MGVASLAGPLIGGLLVGSDLFGLGWRSVFLVTVPVALVSLPGATVLPGTRGSAGQRVGAVGLLLTTVGFGAQRERQHQRGEAAQNGHGHGQCGPCPPGPPARPQPQREPTSARPAGRWAALPDLALGDAAFGSFTASVFASVPARVDGSTAGSVAGLLPTAQQLGGSIGAAAAGLVYFAPAAGPDAAFQHAVIYEAAVFTVTALISLRKRDRNQPAAPRADAARAAVTLKETHPMRALVVDHSEAGPVRFADVDEPVPSAGEASPQGHLQGVQEEFGPHVVRDQHLLIVLRRFSASSGWFRASSSVVAGVRFVLQWSSARSQLVGVGSATNLQTRAVGWAAGRTAVATSTSIRCDLPDPGAGSRARESAKGESKGRLCLP
ncbi:hypothetical protein ACE1SV_63590 [Streptomyces sennicomposti]